MKDQSTKGLAELTDLQLLEYALAPGVQEDFAPLRMFEAARDELDGLAHLCERTRIGIEIDIDRIVPGLEGVVRRLDVAIEALSRIEAGRRTVEEVDATGR